MSASSSRFARITVVLICTLSPASTRARIAGIVWSKWPGMPRTPSCVAGVAPSRLSETAFTPASTIRAIASGVSIGVTDGDIATGMPSESAYATMSKTSERSRQSPPVSTRIGCGRPKAATWSTRARPSALVSSPGSGSRAADARQCRHASRHARVTSQKTSIGRCE